MKGGDDWRAEASRIESFGMFLTTLCGSCSAAKVDAPRANCRENSNHSERAVPVSAPTAPPSGRPRLLDAYCCAGGASMGYHRAGWDVEGVELYPRGDYPFPQHQGDAVGFIREHGHEYDAIAGSPPCQAHTSLTKGNRGRGMVDSHVDLIAATREAMIETGRPYIIENVIGARSELQDPVMLCGLSFGLRVFRHRLFESNIELTVPYHPSHKGHRVAGWRHGVKYEGDMFAVYGDGGGKGTTAEWQAAMGIDWTEDRVCLAEAIPPAFTEYLGTQLLAHVEQEEAA